jgi:hypothetical protein
MTMRRRSLSAIADDGRVAVDVASILYARLLDLRDAGLTPPEPLMREYLLTLQEVERLRYRHDTFAT